MTCKFTASNREVDAKWLQQERMDFLSGRRCNSTSRERSCPMHYVDEPLAVIESWLLQDTEEQSTKVLINKTSIEGDMLVVFK